MRQVSDTIKAEGVISKEEATGYYRSLSAAMRKMRALVSERKSYNARVKGDIAAVQEEIDELTEIVESNRAVREVECTIEYDFEHGKKKWLHKDTGEVVRTTDIPGDELNEEINPPLPDSDTEIEVDGANEQ